MNEKQAKKLRGAIRRAEAMLLKEFEQKLKTERRIMLTTAAATALLTAAVTAIIVRMI